MLLQPSSAYQQLALSMNEAWEKLSTSAPGETSQISKFQPNPNDALTQHKAARSIGAHNTNKRLEC
jgi:hypothetical protein